ncbi:MAG: hypothetical protein LBP74_00720 [Treponema sp.]|nr:hypothetical protein [Treponema sp.]
MKKNVLLTGLISALLIAGMLFTACPTDSGEPSGLSAPDPGDLPDLPDAAGVTPVGTTAEAKALLNGIKDNYSGIRGNVEALIINKVVPNSSGRTWNVKDDTSLPGLKINAQGNYTETSTIREDTIPKAGDYMEISENRDASVEVTGDRTEKEMTFYKGSRIAEKEEGYVKVTIKSMSAANASITITESANASYVYGLTVSHNGKDGKIILDAHAKGSLTKTMTVSSFDVDLPSMEITYSGSLCVYGADDKEVVYREDITNEREFVAALGYFGIDY